jgi:hypothetical protein
VELSVAPDGATLRIYDEANRPDWVLSGPVRHGPHSIVVCSYPKVRDLDSRKSLDLEIKRVTDEYINEHLSSDFAATLLSYDMNSIKRHLVPEENIYHERIEISELGNLHQRHALVEFDPRFRLEIERRWDRIVAKSRVIQTGAGVIGILALLGVAFGYFRLDTATRGYYTGRLQFVAAMGILGLIASGVLLARWIHWM